MKTGYGLGAGDLGYLGYGSKPYSSLTYLGSSKGYNSAAGGLRTKSAFDKDSSIMSKVKKPKIRKTSADKIETPLYKKKTFDFTDYAYREAVNRLKFLLTEAYEPTKVATSFYYRGVDDGKSEVSDNQSGIVERPSLTDVSKYFPQRYGGTLARRYSFLSKDVSSGGPQPVVPAGAGALKPAISGLEVAQPPPELLGFIEKQEGYIEQLERESQYCREELSTLLKKVKDVVSENEALTDRSRSKALYQLDSSESEDVDYDRARAKGKSLSGPSIVFESRISELEAQLAQSQIDLKKLFAENEENKHKLLHGASDVGNADAYRKQVENLQRDKQSLEETVRKLQLSIDQLKDSEACNFSKSQRSRDLIEQVAFERNQGEIEIRRLKDELERQHERVREVQHEMAKRIADERANAERRYTFHVDQLGGDLSSQWEHATKLQLEVERMKRGESDCKRELAQKSSQIDELKLELKNKTAIFMSDLNQASAEKQSLEQEITSLRLQLERAERQSKVEVSRLNAEITSLRQRLDRADADLLHSKRENLKLGDEVASLEKELTLGELNRETRPSKELAKIISDMENKHAATVSELEGMVQDQKQLMEKLTAECKSLTHKLEDTTQKHKEEKLELRRTNSELMERLKQIWTNYKQISPAFRKSSAASSGADDVPEPAKAADQERRTNDKLQTSDLGPEVLHPDIPMQTTDEPASMIRPLPSTALLWEANHLDRSLEHPIDSSTPLRRNHRHCPETTPSWTTASPRERGEASHGCRAARSPTRMARMVVAPGVPEPPRRSQSMDVLSRSVRPEPAIPLNRTAPEVERREVVADCRENPSLTNELRGNRCSHQLPDPRVPAMDRIRCSTPQQTLSSSSSSNSSMEISPTSNSNQQRISSTRCSTTSQRPQHSAMEPQPDTIPRSNSTKDTVASSTSSNSKHMTSSSTKAISNHMTHSSTPLSKFMMNQATSPELAALPCNSSTNSLLHHPHQPLPQYHSPLPKYLKHHQPQHHQPHRLPPYQPEAGNSPQAGSLQDQWNPRRATERWGAPVPPLEQAQTDSDTNSRRALDGKPHLCCNSLPRQQQPWNCDFQPINSYPQLCISSPSLFGSSPDLSLTPSPTSTVLQNYDVASPNPR
ncbi:uncharacterized protein LOC131215185 [Anopheles bellator]|uniref:uncharacterized protein LOC131215185 n=1 Tax=Anopheles bellator TaxID=139047 RepID=UPI0026498EB6|nr:uncharacterized protein LOC131215185 [Anopheles bellator]